MVNKDEISNDIKIEILPSYLIEGKKLKPYKRYFKQIPEKYVLLLIEIIRKDENFHKLL